MNKNYCATFPIVKTWQQKTTLQEKISSFLSKVWVSPTKGNAGNAGNSRKYDNCFLYQRDLYLESKKLWHKSK
jgi:hypothetical protein